jgi:murein DD-endopeptidase MepM/ murein hydrolase activator NlpD
VAHERPTVPTGGSKRVGLTIRITDTLELAIRTDLIVRTPRAYRLPGRRPRRSRAYRALVGVAYAALVSLILTVALAGPAAGRPADLVRASGAPAGALPALPASAVVQPDAAPGSLRWRQAPITVVRDDPPGLGTHWVAPGETLFSIAMRYGISPQTLAYNNGLSDTAALRPGRALLITPPNVAVYDAVEGDTIAGIASRFGVDPEAVRAINRIEYEPTDLSAGRRLVVPVADGRYPGFRLKVSEAPALLAPRLAWPVDGVLTQRFHPGHTGVDIAAPTGTPIYAPDDGTVTAAGWHQHTGGLFVCVRHDWGLETCAFHASAVLVEIGERVLVGQIVARVGSTGRSSGPHVHWEARTNGALMDPLTWVGEPSPGSMISRSLVGR